MSQEPIKNAHVLLNSQSFGILSTISVKLDRFPFGSVVPYCLDDQGRLVILISTIAQHTKNILKDNRCSITIIQDSDEVQSNGRICIIGKMESLDSAATDTSEIYFRNFPKSRSYSNTHNFSFYYLEPVSIRYIGGFGAIHWFEPSDFQMTNPFHGKNEEYVVNHMNEDHHKDLILYCKHYKHLSITSSDDVRMTGIDSIGFDVFVNEKKIRFDFENPVADANEARAALVAMSKEVK